MSDPKNQRSEPRVPAQLPLRIRLADSSQWIEAQTVNISNQGFFALFNPDQKNQGQSKIYFEIIDPNDPNIRAEGFAEVRWTLTQPQPNLASNVPRGAGFKVLERTDHHEPSIREIVEKFKP